MKTLSADSKVAAIACGGTGGHLFPGIAVGRELRRRGCDVTLLVSSKEIDRQAARAAEGMDVVTLPAVGLLRGRELAFAWRFWQSYRVSRRYFRRRPPRFVLAMGGFTGAPPILAGKRGGAKAFLHESNTIPGRANRMMARIVDGAFVYFKSAGDNLRTRRVVTAGMPVRPEFLHPPATVAARVALDLDAHAPVLLVMGGSQGARKINELIPAILPQLRQAVPDLQFLHLTGPEDVEKVKAAYAAAHCPALVRAFLAEMDLALAAADAAVSRAGASSLAEFAACRLPAVLIPYPTAADNHQFHNARAFVQSGAARMVQQHSVTPEQLAQEILAILVNSPQRSAMQSALGAWHSPEAAADIADEMLQWNDRAQSMPLPVRAVGVLNA